MDYQSSEDYQSWKACVSTICLITVLWMVRKWYRSSQISTIISTIIILWKMSPSTRTRKENRGGGEYNRWIVVYDCLIHSVDVSFIRSANSAKPRGSLPRWWRKDIVSNESQYRRLSITDEARFGSSKSNTHCIMTPSNTSARTSARERVNQSCD
jgi:hypothetical protein